MYTSQRLTYQQGFTLLELLFVMMVIMTLSPYVVTGSYIEKVNEDRSSKTVGETSMILNAAAKMYADTGSWPGGANCSGAIAALSAGSELMNVDSTNPFLKNISTSCTGSLFMVSQETENDWGGYVANKIRATVVDNETTGKITSAINTPGSEPATSQLLDLAGSRAMTGNLNLGGNAITAASNITASGTVTAGTVVANQLTSNGNLNVAGAVGIAGDIYTASNLGVNGNINTNASIGAVGSISAGGNMAATGNITGGTINAVSRIDAPYIRSAGNSEAAGNMHAAAFYGYENYGYYLDPDGVSVLADPKTYKTATDQWDLVNRKTAIEISQYISATTGRLETTQVGGAESSCRGVSVATCPAGWQAIGGGGYFVSSCGCDEKYRFASEARVFGNTYRLKYECGRAVAMVVCGR
jgi:type II secretory pathway pseudopilin PulG